MKWTAIIPAAGAGSRLGYHLPKVLYPILGKPMIHWMVELLSPFCSRFVFVLSPTHQEEVEKALFQILPQGRFEIVLQETPTGMADAVLAGTKAVETPFSIVAWGDQVTLSTETVRSCIELHESRQNSLLTLPTIIKSNPYIHFERNTEGRIVKVLQKRENEIHISTGESDCGLFLFDTHELINILNTAKKEGTSQGASTKEFNLLPLLPRFEQGIGTLETLRIDREEETLGVNTQEEAEHVTRILTRRRSTNAHV